MRRTGRLGVCVCAWTGCAVLCLDGSLRHSGLADARATQAATACSAFASCCAVLGCRRERTSSGALPTPPCRVLPLVPPRLSLVGDCRFVPWPLALLQSWLPARTHVKEALEKRKEVHPSGGWPLAAGHGAPLLHRGGGGGGTVGSRLLLCCCGGTRLCDRGRPS